MLIPESSYKPEGMLLPVIYPNKTGWVAFFIMNEAFRRQGYGGELWKAMMARFREAGTSIIGLDGVEMQIETYKRRGFVACAQIPYMTRASLETQPIYVTWDSKDDHELQDLSDIDPQLLARLDMEHTGLDRSAYWATGALTSRRFALGYAIVTAGELTGFIYARHCHEGVRVGPLYAASYAQARQLLHKLMNDYARTPGTFVAEVFGSNSNGMTVFEELGFRYADSFHRMWLGGKVPVEQQEGGKGVSGMYAIFDACAG
jgi:hypothetical protein